MLAYIGLGSNVGDRSAYLRKALEGMKSRGIEIVETSSIYETDPVGPPQPDFLNAVCSVETDLSPRDLLRNLKEIERSIGRAEAGRWGPREIDLDLLLYGVETVDEKDFKLPHPELTNRAFVLIPLLEIAPDLELPSGEPLKVYSGQDSAGVRFHSSLD